VGASIDVADLRVAFRGGKPVLHGVDLTVLPGEVVALVGSNGAGKSTLLRSLVGLVPASGSILIDGLEVTTARHRRLRHLRRGTGFVSQRFGLADTMTVFSNVMHGQLGRGGVRRWWSALARRSERDRAIECLARVGLADRAGDRVDQLSGGQRQRVAVARMLMQEPTLLLADEPVASLDPVAGEAIMALIREVARERGMTAVITMHHLDLARRHTDRIVALRKGRVALDMATATFDAVRAAEVYAETVG
jgi:phosphonate transport system ATP-binding protein